MRDASSAAPPQEPADRVLRSSASPPRANIVVAASFDEGAGRAHPRGLSRIDPQHDPRRHERQVLDGLVAGHPNKIIAHNLQISPRTIEIYRANVMTKMEASSLSELVRMALIVGASGATNS